jgi:MATE family multidrug resistance protein
MILMAFIDGQKRFLNNMNLTKAPLASILISICFHIYLSWLFVWKMKLGIVGTGYAATITNLINYLFLTIISFCHSEVRQTMVWPDKNTFQGITGYTSLGLPFVYMSALEFWVYDIMILMAGYISVQAQACQIIAVTLIEMIWMISIGF